MDIQGKYLTHEDREFITTIGRWTNTRTHVLADMSEEEALEKGLCECWPFEKAKEGYVSKRIAKPVKRKPPVMPRRATTSGFSFMRFDLDDSGKPINIEVRHSWPEKMYDRSSSQRYKKMASIHPKLPKKRMNSVRRYALLFAIF